jgi:hypothetical protein
MIIIRESDEVRLYLMGLKAKLRLEIRLSMSWFWQSNLSFLDEIVDRLFSIPTKGFLLRVLRFSNDYVNIIWEKNNLILEESPRNRFILFVIENRTSLVLVTLVSFIAPEIPSFMKGGRFIYQPNIFHLPWWNISDLLE